MASSTKRCRHNKFETNCTTCYPSRIFVQYKYNANRKGRVFELTKPRVDWLVSRPCAYCGAPSRGIDRVKNQYGYTTLNSVPSCAPCNWLKGSRFSAPDFIAHIHKIIAHSPTYDAFKTRWIETRTSGPDLGGISDPPESRSTPHSPKPESRPQ
jgi:hypothetical protein